MGGGRRSRPPLVALEPIPGSPTDGRAFSMDRRRIAAISPDDRGHDEAFSSRVATLRSETADPAATILEPMVLHICPRCGKLHYFRGRCRDCRKRATRGRSVERQQRCGNDTHSWTRIRRIVLMRDGRCLHCGSTDDLIVTSFPGFRDSADPGDYATLCRPCDERAATRRAA
jgi:predicted RNA-binding Zn-ribbon protein involved in translation (DUF1610 family)